ncbi:MAG: VCBS repeat-containing protein, partial [Candidatus Thermoplasmatota archaeon]|nr:VCBS repeat-containing protein [Candidatus Thermoplasmatota archaeon]
MINDDDGDIEGLSDGNGLTNGNGITNGNGLTDGNGITNGNGIKDGKGVGGYSKIEISRDKRPLRRSLAAILIALLLGGGCIYYLNEESSSRESIEIDGNVGDWAEIETQELVVESSNSNIDLEAVAVSEDEIYLSILTVTKEPLFFSPDGHTLRIFLDTDDSFETGYFIPGMGADYLVEVFGQKSPASTNVTILSSVLYSFDDSRESNDWNSFFPIANVEAAALSKHTECRVSLFDISSTQSSPKKIAWQTSDGQESTDISEIILGINTENIVLEEAKSSLQRDPEIPSSSNLLIDGHFDDWEFIEKYQDSDWNEYQNSPSVTENPNVDIERYKGVSDGLNSFFYLKVYGEMLGGSIVPMATAKQIPVDSYTSGSGLSTVTPITGSSNLPEKIGEDTIYIFLDTNTSYYFGFEVNHTFHADSLIEIRGQNGLINSAKLYNFIGNDSSEWLWQFQENVLAASFGNELELSIPKIEDTFKAYYHLVSWDDSEDFSNGFWVVDQFGSRTTPAWTEHTINGNYDAAWDVYAIDLDRDGDMDVLGAAAGTSQDISWWENDGNESFTKRSISSSYPGANSVFGLDLDKDGDVDVISTGSASGDDVTWWRNDGTPSDGGWTEYTIDSSFEEAWYVRAADIDEDGDIDVVAA